MQPRGKGKGNAFLSVQCISDFVTLHWRWSGFKSNCHACMLTMLSSFRHPIKVIISGVIPADCDWQWIRNRWREGGHSTFHTGITHVKRSEAIEVRFFAPIVISIVWLRLNVTRFLPSFDLIALSLLKAASAIEHIPGFSALARIYASIILGQSLILSLCSVFLLFIVPWAKSGTLERDRGSHQHLIYLIRRVDIVTIKRTDPKLISAINTSDRVF